MILVVQTIIFQQQTNMTDMFLQVRVKFRVLGHKEKFNLMVMSVSAATQAAWSMDLSEKFKARIPPLPLLEVLQAV